MKLIIDISEDTYKRQKWRVNSDMCTELDIAVANGTPIPDNATNGQVIQTLFKPNRVERTNVIVEEYTFDNDWWNAPYQKGGNNERNSNV